MPDGGVGGIYVKDDVPDPPSDSRKQLHGEAWGTQQSNSISISPNFSFLEIHNSLHVFKGMCLGVGASDRKLKY